MPRTTTNRAEWSARIDPLVKRYRRLVPQIGQEDAALAMSAVARMILAVEKAGAVGSHAAVAVAEDSIIHAGKLLEAVGDKSQQG